MSLIRLTKIFNFETAHALYGYDGKCKNVHGHSYKLFVTILGTPIDKVNNPKYGMVIDFSEIKTIVKTIIVDVFDHAIVLNKNSPHIELAEILESQGHKIKLTDYQPTSENMLIDFVKIISAELPSGVKLHSLKLQETENSFAEWYASDN